jgi:hypothetical protein
MGPLKVDLVVFGLESQLQYVNAVSKIKYSLHQKNKKQKISRYFFILFLFL